MCRVRVRARPNFYHYHVGIHKESDILKQKAVTGSNIQEFEMARVGMEMERGTMGQHLRRSFSFLLKPNQPNSFPPIKRNEIQQYMI